MQRQIRFRSKAIKPLLGSLGMLSLGLGAAGLILVPAEPKAQQSKPKASPVRAATGGTTSLYNFPADITNDQLAIDWCANNAKPSNAVGFQECYDLATAFIEANKKTTTDTAESVDGVCNKQTAITNFNSNGAFKDTVSNFDAVIQGLGSSSGAVTYSNYSPKNFGPAANPPAQRKNRESMLAFFSRTRSEFQSNVELYATMSNKDCFPCAVKEKWAVLKSAANIIGRTHNFGWEALKIGSKNENELIYTKPDLEDPPKVADKARPISEESQVGLVYYGSKRLHSTRKIVLSDLSDQWVSALDPDFIKDLKTAICSLVNAPKNDQENAYDSPLVYWRYAKKVQITVNQAFTRPIPKKDASSSGSGLPQGIPISKIQAAFTAEGQTLDSDQVAIKLLPANDSKQCGTSKMEMTPWTLGYDPAFCSQPPFTRTE